MIILATGIHVPGIRSACVTTHRRSNNLHTRYAEQRVDALGGSSQNTHFPVNITVNHRQKRGRLGGPKYILFTS